MTQVQGHARKLKSGLMIRVSSYNRAQGDIRREAMNTGIRNHRRWANDCETKDDLRKKLGMARQSAQMAGNTFIWLKPGLHGAEDPMQQWQMYEKVNAPKWAKDEYRAFWKKAVGIYQKKLSDFGKSIPETFEPRTLTKGKQTQNGIPIPHPLWMRSGSSIMRKGCYYSMHKDGSCRAGEFYLTHPRTKKQFRVRTGKHEIVNPPELEKSWSSNIMRQHPGARWVTITDASSPLHGRHILILPHANKTASIVWAPEQSGLTHKILQPRKKEADTEETRLGRKKAKDAKEAARAKRREEMDEEEVEKLETRREEVGGERTKAKEELHEMIREKAKVETEVTAKERQAIEKKLEKLSKPEQKAERMREISKAHADRRRAINAIIEDAKKVMLGEEIGIDDQHDADKKRIAQAIRDNAEEFLMAHYAIKGHERELKAINKQLRTGMVTHPGSDIVGISDITTADLKRMVEDEKALRDEIKAHYDLIVNTRGGIDQDGNEIESKGAGRKDMDKMISQGSLEAILGITGEMTGTSIISEVVMQELGASNAAILADYYLRNELGGQEYENSVSRYQDYIVKKGNEIALDAVKKGDGYLERARHVTKFTKGKDMLFATRQQGSAAKLAYVNRAYLAYGQAEGGLHMAAELLYQFQMHKGSRYEYYKKQAEYHSERQVFHEKEVDKYMAGTPDEMASPGWKEKWTEHAKAVQEHYKKLGMTSDEAFANLKSMVIKSSNRSTLNAKVKRLGLHPSDVKIERHGHGDYSLRITPGSFHNLINEKVVAQFRQVTTEPSPQSIKKLRENRDDWLPAGIKPYTVSEDGTMTKLNITPEQQAAARLIGLQKKVYLNFEAGTGKSLAYILQKAHLEETTGKPVKMVVSMPKKLMGNFAEEVAKFSDYKVVIVDHADKSKRAEAYKVDPDTIVLVNKEKFYFDHELVKAAGFDMVVADEAHKITQRDTAGTKGAETGSQMSRGLAKIAASVPYYVAGTGTPTPNDLSELHFHLNIMDPVKYSNKKEFMEKYRNLHKGAGLKEKLQDILNAELDDRIYTVKKRVEGSNFNMHNHSVGLAPKQTEKYKAIQKKYLKGRINAMSRDHHISQVLNDHNHKENPKYVQMKSIIDNHIATKGKTEKVLMYARNYTTVAEIEKFVRANYPGKKVVRFSGQDKNGRPMSQAAIAKSKAAYLKDPKVMFAIHTDAGTEGLNLQHTGESDRPFGATTVIAMASGAHSWSTIDQFFSRGYRKGANKDVDGHIILTDTPHDMATEERLREKKSVMNMLHEGSKLDDMAAVRQKIVMRGMPMAAMAGGGGSAAPAAAAKSMMPRVLMRRRWHVQT